MLLYGALIVFFCFCYTALVFNSRETAENLKKSGAFIPGIRPGQQTADYIDNVLTKLTLWGALYVEDGAAGERKFKALAEGGSVGRPFAATFFAKGFGMCVDKCGIPWQVICPMEM